MPTDNETIAKALEEASWAHIMETRTPADVRDMLRARAAEYRAHTPEGNGADDGAGDRDVLVKLIDAKLHHLRHEELSLAGTSGDHIANAIIAAGFTRQHLENGEK